MGQPPGRKATYADLADLTEGGRVEILGGEIQTSPSPRPAHASVIGGLEGEIGGPFCRKRGGPGGWWILAHTELELGPHDVVQPDVAGWRRERVPAFPDAQPIRVVPDWVCEVIAPSTLRRDRLVKADLYLRTGVQHLWFVELDARIVEAWKARDGAWQRLGAWSDEGPARIPPFEVVDIDLTTIFPPSP